MQHRYSNVVLRAATSPARSRTPEDYTSISNVNTQEACLCCTSSSVSFRRVCKICEKWLLASSRLSVRPRGTQLPLDSFSSNLIF